MIKLNKKFYEKLSDIPISETKMQINIVFNDFVVRMRKKINESNRDTSEQERALADLVTCWSFVEHIFKLNEEYYRRMSILEARLIAEKQRNDELQERTRFAEGAERIADEVAKQGSLHGRPVVLDD